MEYIYQNRNKDSLEYFSAKINKKNFPNEKYQQYNILRSKISISLEILKHLKEAEEEVQNI